MSDDDRRGPEWFEDMNEVIDDDIKRAARTFWVLIVALTTILTLGIWGIYEAVI